MKPIAIPLIAFTAAVLLGCSKESPRTQPPANQDPPVDVEPSRRRATAAEIVAAAQSGEIPDWFSAEEAAAVRKLRQ